MRLKRRSPPLRFQTSAELRQAQGRLARRLSAAVDAPSPGGVDQAGIERIEVIRRSLLVDVSPVQIVNYGAGNKNSSRTQEEMDGGWITHNTVADVCRRAASKPRKARMLYSLAREFAPSRALELGTCLGISSAYLATALQQNGSGQLVTLEGAPGFARIAQRTFGQLGLQNVEVRVGRFKDTLPQVLAEGPLDLVFIDGHHDELATIGYHQQLLSHLNPGAVLVFDDIAWSPGMMRAWQDIAAHPSNCISADLDAYGVCVTY